MSPDPDAEPGPRPDPDSDTAVDVAVVGCGPVGVMAALRCAQRGLRVVAIDRSTEIFPLPRALGMDDEIQDVFHRAGLGDELQANSSPLPGGDFVDAAGERVVGVEAPEGHVGALGLPPMVAFDQPGLETALRAAATDAGVDLRLGVAAIAVEATRRGVVLTTDAGVIDSRWLVAADGAKSSVRDMVGVSMVDLGFDQTWLVVDTTLLDDAIALPRIARQHCDAERITTFVPGHRRHRRWEFRLHDDEVREDVLAPGMVRALLAPWGNEDQLRIDRTAVYRFHGRVASAMRMGPCFIAGDAAHQMPPFNGQGMCSGIRDAENLAWKLAAVAHDRADERLLDTYDEERRPHAAAQVAHSVDAGMLIDAIAHDGERALESGYGRRRFPRLAGSMILGTSRAHGAPLPRLGPDTDGHQRSPGPDWTIVATEDVTIPSTWERWGVTIIRGDEHTHPALADHEAVVVRPDRYVAAITDDLSTTTAALAATLG